MKDKIEDRVVLIKGFILYSALYIAGAASSIVAVHQIAPARQAVLSNLSDTSVNSESAFGQVVNRSLKGDRLPIHHELPQASDKLRNMMPAADAPGTNRNIRCEQPKADIDGRCFADAGRASYQNELA